MTAMIDFGFPAKRPNVVENATWQGADDDLGLQCEYRDSADIARVIVLNTKVAGGELCLPAGADVNDLNRDTIIAHIRMSMFLGGHRAWTLEAQNALVDQADEKYFQTPIGGDTKVIAVRDGATVGSIEFDVRKGNQGPIRAVTTTVDELTRYVLTPSTQLRILMGAIKREFPNHVHDYPGTVLSAQEREDIRQFVLAAKPWI